MNDENQLKEATPDGAAAVKYQPYPEYRASGVEWLGEVPAHWEVKQIGHIFKIHNGATPKISEPDYWNGDINWITPEDLGKNFGKSIRNSIRKITSEGYSNCGASLAPSESIALSTRAPIGHLAKVELPSCVNQGCRLLEPQEGCEDYWYYTLHSAIPILVSCGQGTTFMELPRHSLKSIKAPVPSPEEQQTMAAFLDYNTAKIDALIAKQEELLDKLAEKRTALISHAVTKGLDAGAPMRDSGIDWLGKVPAHWEVWKVTHGFNRIGSGTTPITDNPDYYHGETPWVTTSELRETFIKETTQMVTDEAVSTYSALKLYSRGSLVIAMYGATIGRLGILDVKATVNQACCVFSDPVVFDTHFVFYWLWMRRPILISLSNGGGQPNLSQDDLKKICIPIPPLAEQQTIATFLDYNTAKIDEHRGKIESVITCLQEYRSALITNAITGKIDVRHFRAPEAEEVVNHEG